MTILRLADGARPPSAKYWSPVLDRLHQPMNTGHVFVVDDDSALRASISDLLGFAGYRVRQWPAAAAFLADMPTSAPAVLLTDMRMPGMTGVELHAELKRRGRTLPVVYLSGESTLPQGIEAMKLGAFDFVLKPFGREDLLRVVATALEHDRMMVQALLDRARIEAALSTLSPREREVHGLLLKGYGNRELVDELGVSLPTAKQYKSEVMRKLGVRSLAELMAHGRQTVAVPEGAKPPVV